VTGKRPNYYTHQFLQEQDFKDEQKYHIDMRRMHNRIFHSWGIAEGLEVRRHGEHEITISPGVAIDGEGREIVLLNSVTRSLSSLKNDSHAFITIAYGERMDDADHQSAGGVEGHTRVTETPVFEEKKSLPPADGAVITLARVHKNDLGHLGEPDIGPSIRTLARSSSSTSGWVRMSFKPTHLNPVRSNGRLVRVVSQEATEEFQFIVDEANAYCDENGARGSMGIPVPPGASRITGFRIAGKTTGSVTVHLYRTGWNPESKKGEMTMLFNETQTFNGVTFEHHHIPVDAVLNDTHALAVAVIAAGETTIWLVAANFE
jgi:hypothetical protein